MRLVSESAVHEAAPRRPLVSLDQLGVASLVVAARIATLLVEPLPAVRAATRLARGVASMAPSRDADRVVDEVVTGAYRASRVVPGSHCLHRALAARVWLALRGVDARLVLGVRQRKVVEGHAWLEHVAADRSVLFTRPEDGYWRVIGEDELERRDKAEPSSEARFAFRFARAGRS